ncbi:MAG: CapA family protein, partial [Dehalococcoidia bacterium]
MSVRRGALALLATVALVALAVACTGDAPPAVPTSTPTATVEATRTAVPTETATPTPTAAPPLVVAFIGDLMFDREVELAMETEGPAYTFERVRPLFAGADLVVGNLEGTLSSGGTPLDKVYQFQTAPDLGVAALVEGGVDVVSLSNNHATDYGIAGLEETLVALGDLEYYGAGLTEDLARAARHVQPDGQPRTLSFLGYSDIGETIFALGAQGGVSRADVETIAEDVSREREQFPGNVIVVSLHFGTEYRHEPTDRQRELARAAIDAGADLVVGH